MNCDVIPLTSNMRFKRIASHYSPISKEMEKSDNSSIFYGFKIQKRIRNVIELSRVGK